MNNLFDFSAELRKAKIETAVFRILIAAFAVVVLGTVLIPAVLAAVFSWHWLLAYPAALTAIVVLAGTSAKKR